jgi:hypothetical protein
MRQQRNAEEDTMKKERETIFAVLERYRGIMANRATRIYDENSILSIKRYNHLMGKYRAISEVMYYLNKRKNRA